MKACLDARRRLVGRRLWLAFFCLLLTACGGERSTSDTQAARPSASEDERCMRLAIEAAEGNAQRKRSWYGAVVVRDGMVLGKGLPLTERKHDPTAHAEIEAIRAACQALRTSDLSGCTLYSTVEPCPMCFTAALRARIARVVYGAHLEDVLPHSKWHVDMKCEEINARTPTPIAIQGGVLRAACVQRIAGR